MIEEIKGIKESKEDLRKFGYTVGIALIIVSGLLFWFEKENYIYFAIPGLLLILSGLVIPQLLKPLNKIWMTFAILLGWVMTRVILAILFYLAITPIGFIARLARKDFLDLKIDKSRESYWVKRERKNLKSIDYDRQF
jgi:polyferredoxin